jgi:cytochrome c biogenesis protein CcmG, thiol:disulfide interchange protein DsbE
MIMESLVVARPERHESRRAGKGGGMKLLSARQRRWLLLAVSLAVVVPLIYAILSGALGGKAHTNYANAEAIGFTRENAPAPQFQLPLLEHHGDLQLSSLAGRPIVLNFWASYCTICRQESPAIAKVAGAVGSKVRFLGVDTEDEQAAALKFISKYGITYQVVSDVNGVVASKYGVPGLPVTVFISATGKRILGVNLGALTAAGLTSILHKLYGAAA